jgi:glutathione S-transferase
MTLQLYAHPFSSYCQKVLTALYENETPFSWRVLNFGDEAVVAEFATLWPIQRMPVLVDGPRKVIESSAIIEYLGLRYPGPVPLIPADAELALEARFMDRVFDNYVMTPMQKIVFDRIRALENRDGYGVEEARRLLDRAYGWIDNVMAQRTWAAGDAFSLADCAAGPSLFFADWVHPIPEQFASLRDYRARLLARPSFARAVNEARPFRPIFPGGAPDRD